MSQNEDNLSNKQSETDCSQNCTDPDAQMSLTQQNSARTVCAAQNDTTTSRITAPATGLPVTRIRLEGIPNIRKSDGGIQQTTKITIIGAGTKSNQESLESIKKCQGSCSIKKSNSETSQNETDEHIEERSNVVGSREMQSPRNPCFGECKQQSNLQKTQAPCRKNSPGMNPLAQANQIDDTYSPAVSSLARSADGAITFSQTVEKETIDHINLQNKRVRIERQVTKSPQGIISNKTLMGTCLINEQQREQEQLQYPFNELQQHNITERNSQCGQSCSQVPESRLQAPTSRLQDPRSQLQAPRSQLQAPSSRLQAPTSRLQAPTSRLQAPTSRLQAPTSRLQAPSSRLQAPDSRLQAPSSRFRALIEACNCSTPLEVPTSRIQAPSSRLQAPSSRLQAPTSRLQAPSSRLQAPSSRLQTPRSGLQVLSSRTQAPCSQPEIFKSRLQAPGLRAQATTSRLQAPSSRVCTKTLSDQNQSAKSMKRKVNKLQITTTTVPQIESTMLGDLLNNSYVPTSTEDATIADIKTLIEEEKRDVLLSQTLSTELSEKLKKIKKKSLLEETLQETMPTLSVDIIEDGDSSSPGAAGSDVVASLMHSEERGVINTVSSPKRTYDALFGITGALQVALEDEKSVAVSPASPAPLNDIVVPVGEASQEDVAVMMPEIEQQVAQTDQEIPKADAYSEIIQQKQSVQTSTVRNETSKKSPQLPVKYLPRGELEEEKAPWDIDLGSLEDLVGGQLSVISANEQLPSDESIRATLRRFEYILDVEKPKHYSCVQLRGTQLPSWFPGYYFVHSEVNNSLEETKSYSENCVRLENDPSKVFVHAWTIFKPNNIREDSEIVLLE